MAANCADVLVLGCHQRQERSVHQEAWRVVGRVSLPAAGTTRLPCSGGPRPMAGASVRVDSCGLPFRLEVGVGCTGPGPCLAVLKLCL